MSQRTSDIIVRKATPADDNAVLGLMRAALGWKPSDPNEKLFSWKHLENPFGRSPAWVAEVGGEVVGFRTFMRWRFRAPGGLIDAVRAVDTATHPDFQGRGIFTTLTLHALDEMAHEGVSFVFNTPNDRSRPGYLKMGWTPIGRLPIAASVSGPGAAARMLRARAPADLWSVPTSVGENPLDVFSGDATGLAYALASASPSDGFRTDRSSDFMRWRYGMPGLHYRTIIAPGGLSDAALVFRLRRRGGALEAAVCDVLGASKKLRRWLTRELLQLTNADYAISLGVARIGLPLYGQGPLLTYRGLVSSSTVPAHGWDLTLGDIELF